MEDIEFTRGDMVVCLKNSLMPLVIGSVYKVRATSRYFIAIDSNWYNSDSFEHLREYRMKIIDELLK